MDDPRKGEQREVPYYRECPICGDRLDPGETCACKKEAVGAEKGGAVMLYNGKEVLTQETLVMRP